MSHIRIFRSRSTKRPRANMLRPAVTTEVTKTSCGILVMPLFTGSRVQDHVLPKRASVNNPEAQMRSHPALVGLIDTWKTVFIWCLKPNELSALVRPRHRENHNSVSVGACHAADTKPNKKAQLRASRG